MGYIADNIDAIRASVDARRHRQEATDLAIAQCLWDELIADLAHDDGRARTRLIARIQIALLESRQQVNDKKRLRNVMKVMDTGYQDEDSR